MVKAYLRYEAAGCFGVVASAGGNMITDHAGKLLISPALEATHVWNPKTGALVRPRSPTADPPGVPGRPACWAAALGGPRVARRVRRRTTRSTRYKATASRGAAARPEGLHGRRSVGRCGASRRSRGAAGRWAR
jgi:hypothetical protein